MIGHPTARGPWRARGVLLLALLALAPASLLAAEAPHLRLKVDEFDPSARAAALPDRLRYAREPETGYFIVQFDRPIDVSTAQKLRARGAWPVGYVPDQGYLVRLPGGRKSALRAMPEVRWLGPVEPGWKLSPELGTRPFLDAERRQSPVLYVTVDLFPEESTGAASRQITALGAELVHAGAGGPQRRLWVRATRAQLEQVARLQAVSWIEEVPELSFRNDNVRWVMQTDIPNDNRIHDMGLHGEGQIIGHMDGPIDIDSCFFRDPVDNTPGPGHRKIVGFRSTLDVTDHPHGTHTAGIAAGNAEPVTGSLASAGQAYAAKLSHQDVFNSLTGSGSDPSNLYDYLEDAWLDGARTHTNSYGDNSTSDYTTWCVDIDDFSHDYEDSLVIFAVASGPTFVASPENAKNSIAVGATDNALNSDIHCSGSRGPTADGRRKPDMVAPGCDVIAAEAGAPAAQTCNVDDRTGTSMAAPALAGAAALVRQYFVEGWHPTGTKQPADSRSPSGALVKAALINSGVDLSDVPEYPAPEEGWGRLLLDDVLYFDGDLRELAVQADIRNANGLSTAQSDTYFIDVTNDLEDLRVTLVYTDPAAALLAGFTPVNNLDLEVTSPSATLYRGNFFDEQVGHSLPNGSADPLNNVEMVLLPSPELGQWTLKVKGTAVNQGTQGYALLTTGQLSAAAGGSLRYTSHAVDDSGALGNNDGILDPGETIVLPLSLINLRQTGVTSVSARLASGDPPLAQVTADTASYPNLGANGTGGSIAPHYTLTVSPDTPCGSVIPFDLEASHATGSNDSSFAVVVGDLDTTLASTDVPKAIPNLTTVESTLVIGDSFTIGNIFASVNITHPDMSPLRITLISPTGTEVELRDESSGVDLDATYDLDEPAGGSGQMGDFDNESSAGTWTLRIEDDTFNLPPNTGTLNGWSVTLSPATGAFCDPLACAGDPVPAEVGPTFHVDVSGSDLTFDWPSVAGASSYRVWQSSSRQFDSERLVGPTASTSLTETGAAVVGESLYYLVRAANSCNWEGD